MPYSQKQWQDRIKDAQGNIAQEGTPFSAGNMNRMEQGIADAHAQLEEAARQKQTLIHGVSVLNGGVDAPVNIEIEGRTLIPMQNTVLDPLKYYVLADKKTKVKWADATIQSGIAKFTAKAERPTLIRVANFEGKVQASTLENPHVPRRAFATTLQAPSSSGFQEINFPQNLSKLDGTLDLRTTTVNGEIAQSLYSFDLIAEVERQLGRIPRATVADKVQWLKDNIAKLTVNWHGFGLGPLGNKASLNIWHVGGSEWRYPSFYTGSTVGKASIVASSATTYIDTNGFAHYLANAEASDGTTASTINTDYVDLEIELKPEAILHAPRVPLYEVTKAHYDAILVTMLEEEILRRYPSVEGVTHLQNPYVMAEGENLLPSFYEATSAHANVVVNSSNDVTINSTGTWQTVTLEAAVLPNTQYTFAVTGNGQMTIDSFDSNNAVTNVVAATGVLTRTFTTPSNARKLRVSLSSGVLGAGTFTFKEPMLTLGATAKPFTPRNPSYALFETKLGKIGNAADRLFEQDAKYFKRKMVEDVVVDGTWNFSVASDYAGFKAFRIIDIVSNHATPFIATKYNGVLLKSGISLYADGTGPHGGSGKDYAISVADTETGFPDAWTSAEITNEFIKAYFNGWKYTGTADKVTQSWVSLVDGSAAPTQTLDYVKANKAANYTPYKISYVLGTPQISEIKSEGAISVNGLTQVEVGSGVILREKVTPVLNSGLYLINTYNQSAYLKNRSSKILNVFKNSKNDDLWSKFVGGSTTSNGSGWARLAQSDFDATAEYYVTYLVLDRQPFTANPVNVSAQFANNIRAALEDTTKKVEDNTTATSVNTNILYDVLKRLKAGGL